VKKNSPDVAMLDALGGASNLQLYQLKSVIEGMLADPRRGLAARATLHLGQSVRFVDFRDGQIRQGKIIAFRDTQATVLEQGTKRTWKIPCVSMEGFTDANRHDGPAPYEPPPEPEAPPTPARDFQCGDTVTFEDRDGRHINGVIDRAHQSTHRHHWHWRWRLLARAVPHAATGAGYLRRWQEGVEATLTLKHAPVDEEELELPAAPEGEEVVWDYAATGLTLRRHPLAILRPVLAGQGWRTAAELHELPDGRLAKACGIVTVRQQPETAKGVMFVSLEDETGNVQVIVCWR
jgi:hypothetical protein